MSEASTPASNKPRAGPARQIVRIVALVGGALLALVCITLVAGLFWLNTAHARDFLISFAAKQLNKDEAELVVTEASGSLLGTLELGGLVYRDAGIEVAINQLRLQWSPSQLLSRKLLLSTLDVNSVSLEIKPTEAPLDSGPAAGMPDSLALPIDFEISRFSLAHLSVITAEASEPLAFSDLAFVVRYESAEDSREFVLAKVKAITPWGQLQSFEASLGDTSPFPLTAKAQWKGLVAHQTLNVDLAGSGNLDALDLDVSALAGSGSVNLIAKTQPLNAVPWRSVELNLKSINAREFNQTAPRTSLDARISLANLDATTPIPNPNVRKRRDRIQAKLALVNQVPGPFVDAHVPMRQASMDIVAAFRDDPTQGTIAIKDFDLELSAQPGLGASSVMGNMVIDLGNPIEIAGQSFPGITSDLTFQNIDASQWVGTIPPTALVGTLAVTRRQVDLQLAQSDSIPFEAPAGLNLPQRTNPEAPSVKIVATAQSDELLIEQMRAAFNGTVLSVNGRAGLTKPYDVSVEGQLVDLRLDNWLTAEQQASTKLASGQLNAGFSVVGPTLAPAAAKVELTVFDSALGDEALAANAKALLSTDEQGGLARISAIDAKLSLGKNKIAANGALGQSGDMLELAGQLPALEAFDSRITGQLNLDASFAGAFDALRTRLRARGSELRVSRPNSSLGLRRLELDADLPISAGPAPHEKLFLKINADRLKSGDTSIRRARLTIDGTPDMHVYDASASSGPWAGRIRGQGQALLDDNPSWTTTIKRLDIDGDLKARLQGRPTLSISAEQIDLQKLRITSPAGRIAVNQASVKLGETPDFSIEASIRNLIVSDVLSVASDADVPPELGSLQAQGQIAIKGSSAEDLTGSVTLDLDENASRTAAKIGIKPGQVLSLKVSDGRLVGNLALDLPSLSFSQAYTGDDIRLDGAISLRGDIGGTTTKPTWQARIKGADLAVLQRSVGWRLDRGVLNATVTSEQVRLNEFQIASGGGTLAITGAANLPTGSTDKARSPRQQTLFNGQFAIEPNQFVVPIGPGQRIAVSGKTILKGAASGIDLVGDLLVDEGVIEVQGSGAPSAPADLVFVDDQPTTERPVSKDSGSVDGGGGAEKSMPT